MAQVDGEWDCTVESPLGSQRFTLTVASAGARFTGRVAGAIGAMPITDGEVAGDTLHWGMGVSSPLPLTLDCSATVSGDRIAGSVRAGGFGQFALEGTRA